MVLYPIKNYFSYKLYYTFGIKVSFMQPYYDLILSLLYHSGFCPIVIFPSIFVLFSVPK